MIRTIASWFRDLFHIGAERVRLAQLTQEVEKERLKYRVPSQHFNPNSQRRRRREFMYRHRRQPSLQRSGR